MRNSVLTRALSVVLACIMMMSIFAVLPIQASAASSVPIYTCSVAVKSCDYTGKAVTPTVTVKQGSKTLKNGTDYTLKCTNNIYPNSKNYQPKVTITGKGMYFGSMTYYFTINKPKTPSEITASNRVAGKVILDWKSVKCHAYEVEMNCDGDWENTTLVGGRSFTYRVNSKNSHGFRVRSIVINPRNGETSYSGWRYTSVCPKL